MAGEVLQLYKQSLLTKVFPSLIECRRNSLKSLLVFPSQNLTLRVATESTRQQKECNEK
ncbi:hypothetical protein DPMN_181429 [Dreissena polymorpha]|uniref:Uncharacterized protein n=1 Tax=Dreissena polymorpha TaxID=45954 RepID=A0A9D4I4E5_DREPO|nr:hypothetical protein DPMN_181428 [Dreissena polymorpha]KAH3747008.1 hypothetical protein DPMN_181429 [Dreissena polymorpha]